MRKLSYILIMTMMITTACNTGSVSNETEAGNNIEVSVSVHSDGSKGSTETTIVIDKRLSKEFEDKSQTKFSIMLPAILTDEPRISGVDHFMLFEDGVLILAKFHIGALATEDAENCDLSKIKSSVDILDNLIYKIPKCESGLNTVGSFTKEIVGTEKINGLEMTKFTGTIEYGYDVLRTEAHYVAYGISGSDGRPYLIFALDKTETKDQMEEWNSLLDAMVLTFKEDPSGVGLTLE